MLILWLWTGLTEPVHKALGLLLLLVGAGRAVFGYPSATLTWAVPGCDGK